MADSQEPTDGAPTHPLLERLVARGWEFDFFQAVWLLERWCDSGATVGGRGPVADEAIRFRPHVSIGFPPSDVRRIEPFRRESGGDPAYQIDVTFMGLYGVNTPLPLHYAIDVLRSVQPYSVQPAQEEKGASAEQHGYQADDSESTPARDFLDILHHRLVSLFYRSWTKYRYEVTFGRPERDSVTDYLLWLIGCSPETQPETVGVWPVRLIRYAGLLTQHPKSAVGLEGLLTDYWVDLPFRVEQCVGRWVPLVPADLNSVGTLNCALGQDLTVGEQVYDLTGAFDVVVGPVDWTTYLSFLPGRPRFEHSRSLVRLYCSDPLAFNIEIQLHAGEVPPMQLTSDENATRLGYTSWVLTGESPPTSVTFEANITGVEGARADAESVPSDSVREVSLI